MGCIHAHDVEARRLRVHRGAAVPAAVVGNVGPGHGARMDRVDAVDWPRARRHRHLAARQVACVVAHVGELDRCEAPVPVHELRHAGQGGDVTLVPQPHLAGGLGGGVNVALLGADDRPAPLGLHPAHHRHRGGMEPPHAVAVGHLVEAVAGGHRADPHRLEQNVVTGVSGHGCGSVGSAERDATDQRVVCGRGRNTTANRKMPSGALMTEENRAIGVVVRAPMSAGETERRRPARLRKQPRNELPSLLSKSSAYKLASQHSGRVDIDGGVRTPRTMVASAATAANVSRPFRSDWEFR